ncbi:thioredoxin domain-containing protein (plasmid) [Rhizobium ruizarguesonis]|nr:thioredoxin domain-containing protein [Rhizobium ruizarguesonis]
MGLVFADAEAVLKPRATLVTAKPMPSVNININNFQLEVQESPIPVILELWAEGCGSCDTIAQILEEIAVEMKGRIKVAKLDLGKNRELAAQFAVQFVPILAFFKGGHSQRFLCRCAAEVRYCEVGT